MKLQTNMLKSGGSLVLRIPPALCEFLNLESGLDMEISNIDEQSFKVRKIQTVKDDDIQQE